MIRMLPKKWLLLSAAIVLLAGTVCFTAVMHRSSGYLFRNDGTGYFLYAQSMVLDFDTEVLDDYLALDARVPADSPAMSGLRTRREPNPERVVFPWPIGSGLVMAPFYAAGYGLELAAAAVMGREPDPYGLLPQLFFGFGSLFYGWLGFWATYLACRQIAGAQPAGIASLAALIAGPAVFYIFFNPTMAHAPSFALAAVFVHLWWRRWAGEVTSTWSLGLLLGLLIIVRYQNAVFGLLLVGLLWRQARRISPRVALRAAMVAAIACLVPLSVQLIHLSAVHGSMTGGNDWTSDEGLTLGRNPIDLSSPFFFDVLFSCRHGAVYWTPIIGLGLIGLLWASSRSGWAQLFVLVLLVNIYLIGCLRGPPELMESLTAPPSPDETHWSGGHAFGMRYLTEATPLMALGIAVLLARFNAGVRRWSLYTVLGSLVVWNGLLLIAYGSGEISRVDCVTHAEMASGAVRTLDRLVP